MSVINEEALVNLVRNAMGSGVVCFTDRLRAGQINSAAPLDQAFGDFPAEFVRLRRDLVEALTEDSDG